MKAAVLFGILLSIVAESSCQQATGAEHVLTATNPSASGNQTEASVQFCNLDDPARRKVSSDEFTHIEYACDSDQKVSYTELVAVERAIPDTGKFGAFLSRIKADLFGPTKSREVRRASSTSGSSSNASTKKLGSLFQAVWKGPQSLHEMFRRDLRSVARDGIENGLDQLGTNLKHGIENGADSFGKNFKIAIERGAHRLGKGIASGIIGAVSIIQKQWLLFGFTFVYLIVLPDILDFLQVMKESCSTMLPAVNAVQEQINCGC